MITTAAENLALQRTFYALVPLPCACLPVAERFAFLVYPLPRGVEHYPVNDSRMVVRYPYPLGFINVYDFAASDFWFSRFTGYI